MSTATKIVVVTVLASALLAAATIGTFAFA